jgi:hypothetical protein
VQDSSVRFLDAIAAVLVLVAAAAFVYGNAALAQAQDLQALYWLIVGVVAVRAAVQIARPGAGA